MPKHLTPKDKREALAEFETLAYDLKRTDAANIVGKKYGVSHMSILSWAKKAAKRPQEPTEIYRPFNLATTDRAVALTGETTVEAFISDVHWHPEASHGHDPAAWAITANALKMIQPSIVFMGGDIVDCYAPSRYEKIPRLATPEAFNGEIHYASQVSK